MLLAWWMRRHTTVSIRNLYLATIAAAGLDTWALQAHATNVLIVTAPITSFVLAASAVGRRWRLSDLGAARSSARTNAPDAGFGSHDPNERQASAYTSPRKARSSANVHGPPASRTSR